MANQMHSSIKTAMGELRSIAKKRKAAHQKKQQEQSKTKAAVEARNLLADEALERKRLSKAMKMTAFNIDFAGLGIKSAMEYETDQELREASVEGKLDFSTPILLKKCTAMETSLADTSDTAKLKSTLDRWHNKFVDSAISKGTGVAFAPLMAQHGAGQMDCVKALMMPPASSCLNSALPRFTLQVEASQLVGINEHVVITDFEAEFLASYKWVYKGHLKFYCMPASDLVKAMECHGGAKATNIGLNAMKDFMDALTSNLASAIHKDGLRLVVGSAPAGAALMIPAGWICSTTCASDDRCTVVRRSFVPKCQLEEVVQQLTALKGHCGNDDWIETLLDLISIHRVSGK